MLKNCYLKLKEVNLHHNSEQIRSFVAIELPQNVKNELAQLEGKLERAGDRFVKWVNPRAIHLTLKFLGNVPTKQIPEISNVIEQASKGTPPLHLQIASLGVFPNVNRPRVLWVGIKGETDSLQGLQQKIDSALVSLGFAEEKQPFTPHLTLARIREGTPFIDRKDFGELVMSTDFESKHPISVETINLVKSQLTPEGAIYTCLLTVQLQV